MGLLFPDPKTFTRFAIFKGIFFIAVTSLLLYVLIARFVARISSPPSPCVKARTGLTSW